MIDYSEYSDVGGRSYNEDALGVYMSEIGHCFTVCDGLGGHSNGDVASRSAVGTIENHFMQMKEVSKAAMAKMIDDVQREVRHLQENPAYSDTQTTLTCLISDSKKAILGYVGDSRIYYIRNRKIIYQSEDHSVPYALFKSGRIKEKEIRGHEDSNMVMRAIGMEWDEPKYSLNEIEEIRTGDSFLLCTDGFWEYIYENEILRTLRRSSGAEDWMRRMTNIVKKRQGVDADNCSAVAGVILL